MNEILSREIGKLDYLPLLARLGPAPTIAEVTRFLGMSAHELISQGKLDTYEISPGKYSQERVVLNTLFEFLQDSPEARHAVSIAAAINSVSGEEAKEVRA